MEHERQQTKPGASRKSGARAKRSREGKEGAQDEESDQDTETGQDCAKPLRSTRQRVGPSQRRDKRRGTGGAGKGRGTNVDDLTEVGESLQGGRDHQGQSQIDHLKGRAAGEVSEPTETTRTWERISVVVFHERFPGGARKEGRGHRADRKKSAHAPARSPSTPERRVGIQTSEERGRGKHGVGEGRPISFEWVLATLLTMSCFLLFHLTTPFRTHPPRGRAE